MRHRGRIGLPLPRRDRSPAAGGSCQARGPVDEKRVVGGVGVRSYRLRCGEGELVGWPGDEGIEDEFRMQTRGLQGPFGLSSPGASCRARTDLRLRTPDHERNRKRLPCYCADGLSGESLHPLGKPLRRECAGGRDGELPVSDGHPGGTGEPRVERRFRRTQLQSPKGGIPDALC